jgi:hypothetical protein
MFTSRKQQALAGPDGAADAGAAAAKPLQAMVKHVLFPALRASFAPPLSLSSDGSIVQASLLSMQRARACCECFPVRVCQVAALTQLYKVFERC